MKNDRTVIKVRLKEIYKDNINYDQLQTTIENVNELMHIAYLFIRSFLLYAIEQEISFVLDETFIKAALSPGIIFLTFPR